MDTSFLNSLPLSPQCKWQTENHSKSERQMKQRLWTGDTEKKVERKAVGVKATRFFIRGPSSLTWQLECVDWSGPRYDEYNQNISLVAVMMCSLLSDVSSVSNCPNFIHFPLFSVLMNAPAWTFFLNIFFLFYLLLAALLLGWQW